MAYVLFPADHTKLLLPHTLFPCPICGAELLCEIDEWERADDGLGWKVAATGLHMDCTTEPAIDSDAWLGWHHGHYDMPYVDWLPLERPILEWINTRYRWQRSQGGH